MSQRLQSRTTFQPTLPTRGATFHCQFTIARIAEFQPTLPTRGATRFRLLVPDGHAISTHAPHTGSDGIIAMFFLVETKFQPTLPTRGATLPPLVACQFALISTHAPHTGSDTQSECIMLSEVTFQPTLPTRGATVGGFTIPALASDFNPRSPHGERHSPRHAAVRSSNFNPRSPHGERRMQQKNVSTAMLFQPTLPTRGATWHSCSLALLRWRFQPTLPTRGATHKPGGEAATTRFQPTLPTRGATAQSNNSVDQNHRLCTKSIP